LSVDTTNAAENAPAAHCSSDHSGDLFFRNVVALDMCFSRGLGTLPCKQLVTQESSVGMKNTFRNKRAEGESDLKIYLQGREHIATMAYAALL